MTDSMTERLLMVSAAVLLCAPPLVAQSIDPAARAAVVKAQNAQATRRGYRVMATMSLMSLKSTMNAQLIYVAPDRDHWMDLDGLSGTQYITIRNQAWVRSPDEKWKPAGLPSPEFLAFIRRLRGPTAIADARYKLREVRALGPSEWERIKTRRYRYVVTRESETETVTMWVAELTGLPVRFEAEVQREDARRETWDVTYDDTLMVQRPTDLQTSCDTGPECVDLGRRYAESGNRTQAADLYDKACKADEWDGCFGYATHVAGLVYDSAQQGKARPDLTDEGLSVLERVISARPEYWQAFAYTGLLLRVKSTNETLKGGTKATRSPATQAIIDGLMAQADGATARAVASRKAANADLGRPFILWAP